MNVSVATTILSESNAALIEQYFGKDKDGNVDEQKMEAARVVRLSAQAFKIMQSRVIEDKKDWLKCAYRFHKVPVDYRYLVFIHLTTSAGPWGLKPPRPPPPTCKRPARSRIIISISKTRQQQH